MNNVKNDEFSWIICPECKGTGKKKQRLQKKVRQNYQRELAEFEASKFEGIAPIRPSGHLSSCLNCSGSGLVSSATKAVIDNEDFPHVAIIGGGIGGVALAVACLHRGIPFTIYERDSSFDERSQGYGLTLQQASKAIEGLGIFSLDKGVISTRHLVHKTDGEVIGEWGIRKWLPSEIKTNPKRTNIHIARQALRLALLEQLGGQNSIHWNHQLIDFEVSEDKSITLSFQFDGKITKAKADLVVGADGIRSAVRKLLFGVEFSPLRYLDCIVILGICPLNKLENITTDLLDSATVFQTANGKERIYIMPYDSESVMWQLSFPMAEEEAKNLSAKGPKALKEEACRRTQWHAPIPQILEATLEAQISGYPVYDREVLKPEDFKNAENVTLIGDASHPMSPFKGQGANQALLDALALARAISKGCQTQSNWKTAGLRASVLADFEAEMLARSEIKVKDSAAAAEFLHSEIVLHQGDEPRGRCIKK